MKAVVNKCGPVLQDDAFTILAFCGVYYGHRSWADSGRDDRFVHGVGAQRDALFLVNRRRQ